MQITNTEIKQENRTKVFGASALWLISLLAVGFLLLGCSNDEDDDDDLYSDSVSCSTYVSSYDETNKQVTLSIAGFNGESPYSIYAIELSGASASSISGTTDFTYSTSLTATFSSLSSITGLTGSVTIMDSDSDWSTCSFSVSGTTTTGSLTCTMTPTDSTPSLYETVYLTMTGSGGTAPYTFSSLSPGTYGSITANLYSTGDYTAAAAVRYSTATTVTPTVTVTDTYGNTGTCYTTLTVQSGSSSGSLTCAAYISPNPSSAGSNVSFYATISGSSSWTMIDRILVPSGYGITGQFSGATSGWLNFPYSGSYLIKMEVIDGYGYTGECTVTQTVY